MVLIVEWGLVPVDVDVEVGEGTMVTEDTGEVQGNIISLVGRGGSVESVSVLESEGTNIIIALRIDDNTSVVNFGVEGHVSGGKETLDETLSWHVHEVLGGEEVNVKSGGASQSNESGGGDFLHLYLLNDYKI